MNGSTKHNDFSGLTAGSTSNDKEAVDDQSSPAAEDTKLDPQAPQDATVANGIEISSPADAEVGNNEILPANESPKPPEETQLDASNAESPAEVVADTGNSQPVDVIPTEKVAVIEQDLVTPEPGADTSVDTLADIYPALDGKKQVSIQISSPVSDSALPIAECEGKDIDYINIRITAQKIVDHVLYQACSIVTGKLCSFSMFSWCLSIYCTFYNLENRKWLK